MKRFPALEEASNGADLSLEEQVRREVYIAIPNSAPREVGSKVQLAVRLAFLPSI